jgi:integrase
MKLKADRRIPGLYVRTLDTGNKSYVVVTTGLDGKRAWHTLGSAASMTVAEARDAAIIARNAIRGGGDRAAPQTVEKVAEQFIKRHVQASKLRSEREIRRYFDLHILPLWGAREFTSIKRGDVANLLDKVDDNVGPVAADKVLAHISKLCAWYATRHNDYVSPVVRGMRRSNPKERAGKRILDDDELRLVWAAAEANGMFGAFIRLLLLAGQRREKLASMKWADVVDGVWLIPAEKREKGNALALILPAEAQAILDSLPRFVGSPYVFTTGRSYFKGYSKAKADFDAKVPIAPWKLHDLRRTARSLMSRAHVAPHVAELTLGHVQKGVVAVYDKHTYLEEKAHALKALAGLIDSILRPPSEKVHRLRG